MKNIVSQRADKLAELIKEFIPENKRHQALNDFALLRNWAEMKAEEYDEEKRLS